ncbi:MAG: tetratricopeptide repeat protein [Spirochaetales bacterium]|nr:tetratricopeptide repeat protein [Spirochaetales bacterium]
MSVPEARAQAQSNENLPGWVLFEKGKALYEQGDLSGALELINLSAGKGVLTPEALYWIGRVYQAEGDNLLARKRYEEALADARFLYIPDTKWDIYYSLSEIYLIEKDYDRYEQILLTVFDEEVKRNTEIIRREHSYVQVLKTEGLDKLLLLYRIKLSYSLEASSRLGRYYNSRELWKSSVIKNLYPLMTVYTAGIESLINRYPDFSFPVNMEEAWGNDGEFLIRVYEDFCRQSGEAFSFQRDLNTLEAIDIENDVMTAEAIIKKRFPRFSMTPSAYTLLKIEDHNPGFLNMEALYSSMFFLAEALYREGHPDSADELWALLILSGNQTPWKKLAEGKIMNPELETPFLKY